MELHPSTADVMAKLEYDHIDDYLYVLKDDLEMIVSHKLQRSRNNPVSDVQQIVQKMLNYQPKNPPSKCQCGIEFRSVSDLIRDTAVHYLKEYHARVGS